MRRSSSVPVRPPLKSLLASSPPHGRDGDHSGKGKRAHFSDDIPKKDNLLRRTPTAPANAGRLRVSCTALEDQQIFSFDDEVSLQPSMLNTERYEISMAIADANTAAEVKGDVQTWHRNNNNNKDVHWMEAHEQSWQRDGQRHSPQDRDFQDETMSADNDSMHTAEEEIQVDVDESDVQEFVKMRRSGNSLRESEQTKIFENEETDDPDRFSGFNDSFEEKVIPRDTVRHDVSQRRLSHPAQPVRRQTEPAARRATSMTELAHPRVKLHPFSPTVQPAHCAVTAVSIRVAHPTVDTGFESPRHERRTPLQTAQTVRSGLGTYQMLWEEPASSQDVEDSASIPLMEFPGHAEPAITDDLDSHVCRAPSPMTHVRTRLTAWSWARELEGNEGRDNDRRLPLLNHEKNIHTREHLSEISEESSAPPNTARSSAKQSARASSPASLDDDEEEGRVVELKARSIGRSAQTDHHAVSSKSNTSPPVEPRLATPVPRQFSHLVVPDEHFRSHRDSVEIFRRRMDEGKLNHHLIATTDSFLLTKSKYDIKRPNAAWRTSSSHLTAFNRAGALTPIMDASPPNAVLHAGVIAKPRNKSPPRSLRYEDAHPDEHRNCGICSVEQPRWHEHHHGRKRWRLETLE